MNENCQSMEVLASVTWDGRSDCRGGSCPTVYHSEPGYLVVQGKDACSEIEDGSLPADELAVKIPIRLIERLVEEGIV